jgi:predicted ester cyclase
MTTQSLKYTLNLDIDYSNPQLAEMVKEKMEKTGMTVEQIKTNVEKEIFTGFNELIESDLKNMPGFSFKVERG